MRSTEDYPTTYVLIQSFIKQLTLVVKQFHACNKSDHLQLRPEPPLQSNFCFDNARKWNIRPLFGKVSLEKFSDIRLYVKRSLCGRKYTDEYTVN